MKEILAYFSQEDITNSKSREEFLPGELSPECMVWFHSDVSVEELVEGETFCWFKNLRIGEFCCLCCETEEVTSETSILYLWLGSKNVS
mgnify:CR=1 FL=1